MIILGVDPGLNATGFAFIDVGYNPYKIIQLGDIKAPANFKFEQKLANIYSQLDKVIQTYLPHIIVVESLFFGKNPSSLIKLSHARGVAICAGMNHQLGFFEYSPKEIKQIVTTNAQATKEEVKFMLFKLLNFEANVSLDATDALAIAYTHAHHIKID